MSKETLNIVKKFLKAYSIETTPNVYNKYGRFSDFLEKNHEVYITYLPDENSDNVISTAKKLKDEGFEVIPHLPARTILNENELEKYVGELANGSGCSKILIIGGGGNQAGNISSTMDVLKSDLLSKFNYKYVGIAGHPEGSPDISNENLDLAIKEKNNFSKNVDFQMYITTQFFFEAKSLIDWEKHLTTLGNSLPIHAGIPGPASIKTLINYARSCGIGNSLRFISKQAFNLTKLATLSTPDKLLYELANYIHTNQSTNLEKIHFYAFGGIKKTADWLNQLDQSELNYNNKNQFEL